MAELSILELETRVNLQMCITEHLLPEADREVERPCRSQTASQPCRNLEEKRLPLGYPEGLMSACVDIFFY